MFLVLDGILVKVTQNINLKLRIANGTEAIIVGVQFSRGTEFQENDRNGLNCSLSTKIPAAVFVDFKRTEKVDCGIHEYLYRNLVFAIVPWKKIN